MICEFCRKSFRPNPKAPRSKVKFCSFNCRLQSHRQHQKELQRHDWHSPVEVIDAAREVMGHIDLDPASSAKANEIVRAERFYSVKDDGLKQPWAGRIWLNPPYGRYAPKFVKRFTVLFSSGEIDQGILLLAVHHLTTSWIDPLMILRPMLCLPTRRLVFSQSILQPMHGSVILGVGVDPIAFAKAFSPTGSLWNLYQEPFVMPRSQRTA